MKQFSKMTPAEISAEVDRYQLQLLRQQAEKIPLTNKQLARWRALASAYRKIQADFAK